VGDPLFKGAHEKHVILYPGFKDASAPEPFKRFHDYLAGAVAQASSVLFIGFAFRDNFINDILRRFTASHAQIIVIDPAAPLDSNPYPEGRVLNIAQPFGSESVAVAVNTLAVRGRGA
jgi:hypothetical protein